MIVVDWGGSTLRLYRIDANGLLRERRRSDQGAIASRGRHAQILAPLIEDWDDERVLMCGMVGAQGGWLEMPYLDCPAGLDELAAGLQRIDGEALPGRELWMMAGLRDADSGGVPDMMRGEETQLVALLDTLPGGTHLVCLPGTHSKWVTLRDRRVHSIATAMTGEVYAVMCRHSILGQSMHEDDGRFDAWAFDEGLRRSAHPGGLLHHLFGVRAMGITRRIERSALPSYLSGLLIGHEIHASGLLARTPRVLEVHLVGSERLLASYAHALTTLGVGVRRHPEDLAAHGLHVLWSRRMATELAD